MLATDHIDTARQFLADADREYESGDILQASEKLWGAASHAVVAEMQARDIDANGHRKVKRFVQELSEELDDPLVYSLFKHAETLHVNFYHGFLSEENFEEHRELVRRFVNQMLTIAAN